MTSEEVLRTHVKVTMKESLKADSKRHIVVNEDGMQKKVKGVGEKMEVEGSK